MLAVDADPIEPGVAERLRDRGRRAADEEAELGVAGGGAAREGASTVAPLAARRGGRADRGASCAGGAISMLQR